MRRTMRAVCVLAVALLVRHSAVYAQTPLGTEFTYQGQLKDGGIPADGDYDFLFRLFDSPNAGAQVGGDVLIDDWSVSDGLFTVQLDFGDGVFTGDAIWLEAAVRPGESGNPYTVLSPRQPLNAAPYALYALDGPAFWAASGNDIYSTNSGNVGIGTDSPDTKLEVEAGGPGGFRITSPFGLVVGHLELKGGAVGPGTLGTLGAVDFLDSSEALAGRIQLWRIVTPPPFQEQFDGLSIIVGGTEAMQIRDDGAVAIGATQPLGRLRVEGGNVILASDGVGKVGIGTGSPQGTLEVTNDGGNHAIWATTSSIPIYARRDSTTGTWPAVHGENSSEANGTSGVRGKLTAETPGASAAGVYGFVGSTGSNGAGVRGYHSGSGKGVLGEVVNSNGYAGYFLGGRNYFEGSVGIGTSSPQAKLDVHGNVMIHSASSGLLLIELGEGLDYAEGFDVSDKGQIIPGMVLVIDADNPGKLVLSTTPYDRKVAGIVAGANGLGSAVRLGADQFDLDVALAGRVYCLVDATESGIEPGDLLTTSSTPGHAMKVTDHARAQGAILGKAMERLEEGERGQILVLVTLQ